MNYKQNIIFNVYTDGATVGNNEKLGSVKEVGLGFYIKELKVGAGKKTNGISNNEAEFKALIWCMKFLISKEVKKVCFYLDSKIVVNRANGKRPKKLKYKNERMDAFQDDVLNLSKKFEYTKFKWVPREENKEADYFSKKYI